MMRAIVVAALLSTTPAWAQGPAGAAQRMAQPGPEELDLRKQTGTWAVVATMWPAPGAEPVVTKGLVAKREMIGSYLQETMSPGPGSQVPDFKRLDYLNYDRVEGRWKYVSMDTRLPVSIMPAASFGPADNGVISMQFQPQGFVGMGKDVEGRFMLSSMTISAADGDHLVKEQTFNMATGDGKPWRFIRYEYTRQKK